MKDFYFLDNLRGKQKDDFFGVREDLEKLKLAVHDLMEALWATEALRGNTKRLSSEHKAALRTMGLRNSEWGRCRADDDDDIRDYVYSEIKDIKDRFWVMVWGVEALAESVAKDAGQDED